jgi:hypothetical protein
MATRTSATAKTASETYKAIFLSFTALPGPIEPLSLPEFEEVGAGEDTGSTLGAVSV